MRLRILTLNNLIFAFILLLCAGIGASAVTTTDPTWVKWHFSQLGEGGTLSAHMFNATMILSGLMLWLYAAQLRSAMMRHLSRHQVADFVHLYRLIFRSLGVALAGVGLVARDQHLLLHDIFGYGVFTLCVLLVFGSALIPQFFPRDLQMYSAGATIITLILWAIHAGFQGNIVSMTQVEIVGATGMFVWLWLFTSHITSNSLRNPAN